jgi:hypothetical protein
LRKSNRKRYWTTNKLLVVLLLLLPARETRLLTDHNFFRQICETKLFTMRIPLQKSDTNWRLERCEEDGGRERERERVAGAFGLDGACRARGKGKRAGKKGSRFPAPVGGNKTAVLHTNTV